MDSTIVQDAATAVKLIYAAVTAVFGVVTFFAGRIHALRKKK